jgi:hypothetical protein
MGGRILYFPESLTMGDEKDDILRSVKSYILFFESQSIDCRMPDMV